ncbi:TetR/AcrR family transcriptional regulator [Rhodococcus sp. IEGM1428]|uniref:TetR/AcrR family transcriptional regulator n=1 Tax=Rhodococcus sp. IEGM1428 TaxID=3392191 RepID=UPI003D0A20C3
MGRPNLADTRREEILESTARCIAMYGFSATTLSKISEESGMSRGHIRHYVGNRDELMKEFTHWLLGQQEDQSRRIQEHPDFESVASMLDYLFGPELSDSNDDNTIILELLKASRTDETLRGALFSEYGRMQESIRVTLESAVPHALPSLLDATAYSLLSIALGNALLSDLNPENNSDDIVRTAGEQIVTALIAASSMRG